MKRVYELDVYKLAEELSDRVWYDFDKWNRKVQNTIGYQIIRSSDSIASNIAEGYGRYTPADRKKFYLYSRGSLYQAIVEKLGPKLNAFINSAKAWSPNFKFLFSNFSVLWTLTMLVYGKGFFSTLDKNMYFMSKNDWQRYNFSYTIHPWKQLYQYLKTYLYRQIF